MPWQQHVADVAMEVDTETGRLAYSEVVLTVPRQSGKSTLLLAVAAHRCSATGFFGAGQRALYSAQTRKDSRQKFEQDFLSTLAESRTFVSRTSPHLSNGLEHVKFANGSRFGIESTTEKSGHGSTLDLAFVDEAFAQVDGRVEQGFRPAMITRPNAQLWVVSTAGWLDGSPYLQAKIDNGRRLVNEGAPSATAFFEWSAPEDADPFDAKVWQACMPALGLMRPDGSGITTDKIAAELAASLGSPEGLNGFRRPYLNQSVPKSAPAVSVIPREAWDALADTSEPAPKLIGRVVLAVDTDPDRTRTSIVAAADSAAGVPLVELIENRPGVEWAVARVLELKSRHDIGALVIDRRSAAASLISAIDAAHMKVISTTASDLSVACGQFHDAAIETGALRHLGQPELLDAITGATTRPLGDAWAWDRKKPTADITPLVAATLALWGHTTRQGRPANAGRGRVIAFS